MKTCTSQVSKRPNKRLAASQLQRRHVARFLHLFQIFSDIQKKLCSRAPLSSCAPLFSHLTAIFFAPFNRRIHFVFVRAPLKLLFFALTTANTVGEHFFSSFHFFDAREAFYCDELLFHRIRLNLRYTFFFAALDDACCAATTNTNNDDSPSW